MRAHTLLYKSSMYYITIRRVFQSEERNAPKLYSAYPREYNVPVRKQRPTPQKKVPKMERILTIDADIVEKAAALRHELHTLAELSGREAQTKRKLMDFLRDNTKLTLVDMGDYFYAVCRAEEGRPGGEKRRIAFRADMDALPIDEGTALPYCSKTRGVSHKCGHDGHSASLAAFALTVDRYGCENDIFFLFQNAEETGAGAEKCAEIIEKEHIDEIFGYHNMPGFPLGSVAVHTGCAACASTGLVFRFSGRNSHASQPENGRNPGFAIAALTGEVPQIVRVAAGTEEGAVPAEKQLAPGACMSPDGIVMCTVVGLSAGSREDGTGEAFGTSAGFGKLCFTVRAESEKRMDALEKMLTERAAELASQYGLEISKQRVEPFPETRNDASSAEKVRAAARTLGLPPARWDEPFRSSEDFGWYTKLIPGALFYIGCGEAHAPLHTVNYDFEDALIPVAAALFLELSRRRA